MVASKDDISRLQTSNSQDDISSKTSMVSDHGSGAAVEEAVAPAKAPKLPESRNDVPFAGRLAGLTPMKRIDNQSGFVTRTTATFERTGLQLSRGIAGKPVTDNRPLEESKDKLQKANKGIYLAKYFDRRPQAGLIEMNAEMEERKQRYIEHIGKPPNGMPREIIASSTVT